MSLKEEYLTAISNKRYDRLVDILVKNLINSLDYKSLCDLGTCLCDVEDMGITIKLDRNDCEILGKNLLLLSYYNHPDVYNALALQLVCLERNSDFQTVADMTKTAVLLNNSTVINNIAYAKFKLEKLDEAYELQKQAVSINSFDDKNDILNYNLMLYDLFLNHDVKQKYDCKQFLNVLISDNVYDYESAMILAAFYDDYDFVKSNLAFFEKTFICDKNVKCVLNNYELNGIKPNIGQLLKILFPKTYYEKFIYITE